MGDDAQMAKKSAENIANAEKEKFDQTLLVKHTNLPTEHEHDPGFKELETSIDIAQTFCQCGSNRDALASASRVALALERHEFATKMTMETTKDRVRSAVASCCLAALKQPKLEELEESQVATHSVMGGKVHELFRAT